MIFKTRSERHWHVWLQDGHPKGAAAIRKLHALNIAGSARQKEDFILIDAGRWRLVALKPMALSEPNHDTKLALPPSADGRLFATHDLCRTERRDWSTPHRRGDPEG